MFRRFLKQGLLDQQKPRKRKKKNSKLKNGLFYFASSVVVLFVVFLAYLRIEPKLKSFIGTTDSTRIEWKVSISPQDYKLLKPSHRQIIDKSISSHLLTGSRDELQRLSDDILRKTEFDKVSIRRAHYDRIVIDVQIPEPIALIETDITRFLSVNGSIYGSVDKEFTSSSNFVLIKGIFKAKKTPYKLSKTNKLITTEKQDRSILNTMELLKQTQQFPIQIREILHNDYRGLALVLESGTFVSLGHKPYEKKIERLAGIIQKSKTRGESLSRIELDYAGKAFIQKSKLEQEL